MKHYDDLETRDPEMRERALLAALPMQVAHARSKAAHYAAILADVDPRAVDSREALAALPVTRKSELIALQKAHRPFGGLTATAQSHFLRVFMSPGPIYDPEGKARDYWRFARALYAAGFRGGQLVHNSFSYHLTPAGAMLESGAFALGCTVIPGGVGQTELQATAIADLRPDGYVGTPSFLRLLLEKGAELGLDLSSLARALVSGEAFPPALQKDIAGHGIAAFQAYASADLGVIAYESEAREGLVLDEGILVEILRPGTGDPVPDGEVGEVAITSFSPDYPLIRFATGDLSAILPGASPCGRTNRRLRGWLGRADQTTKVRGMFVHPAQIAEVARRHPDLGRVRLTVTSENINDVMSLAAETADTTDTALAARVVETLTAVTKLRGKVDLVAPGSLPNDGKVIDDRRPPG